MKRFHLHLAVDDLDRNITFYSTLFGVGPSVKKPDYAKWMLDDPRVNFAISARGGQPGVDHAGIQVEDAAELADMESRLARAGQGLLKQESASCCYAKSNKHWITDPQGIAWETFHTLSSIPVFGADDRAEDRQVSSVACCAPESVSVRRSTP